MSLPHFKGGYCSTSGNQIVETPSDTVFVPKGLDLDTVYEDTKGIHDAQSWSEPSRDAWHRENCGGPGR